jgi:dolichol-phosphate mannosyltransferase
MRTGVVPELSVIVPTYNERDNIEQLIIRLDAALNGIDWEVIFVDDDSPDQTLQVVQRFAACDPRVRNILRVGRRGLAGACLEGMLASSARYVAVIDGDLQHDEKLLSAMLSLLRGEDLDLVVGSRYIGTGSASSFSEMRLAVSRLSTILARWLLKVDLTDPMSGFFMIRRERIPDIAKFLSTQGFKILLDIIVTGRGELRFRELPYVFRPRHAGKSKLENLVIIDFFGLLLSKVTADAVPIRFLLFALVGALGLVVHLTSLGLLIASADLPFATSQILATLIAMTGNFLINNRLTYRDQRLKGVAILRGLVSFYLVCSVGVVSNVGVATLIYENRSVWWVAGGAGALMGALWNYAMSNQFVWRVR